MKIIFLVFFSSYLTALIYPYRDIKQPIIKLEENTQVHIITAARTGSTLIFNIMQYIFEYKKVGLYEGIVTKHHSMFNEISENDIIVTCIRDPLSICASRAEIKQGFTFYDPILENTKKERNKDKLITFRYEDFENNNFSYIYDVLEKSLDIKIDSVEKEYIWEIFNISSMKQMQVKYKDFSECNRMTGIHGNHINHSNWKKIFNKIQASKLYKRYYKMRKIWGYPDIDIDEIYNN